MNRFIVGMVVLGSIAAAGPITYTETASGTGTIGNQVFTSALLTFNFTGDTSNVTGAAPFFVISATGATVNIAGIGTATITDSGIEVFVNETFSPPAAGFAGGAGSILDTFNTAFAPYALTTAIGPITGTSFIRPDLTFATTLGGLNISSAGNATFTAITGVPEPLSVTTLGIGLFAIVISRSVRRR